MQPTLSIILPIYNKEPYIKKCMESILSQRFKDFEVIIINDGSTDESEKRILESIHSEPRVQYHSYPNGGVSIARNRGIELSKGKYLLFIDADDWIEEDYLEKITENLVTDADIYIWGITKDFLGSGTTEVVQPNLTGTYQQTDFLELFVKEQYLDKKGLYGYVPNKLIKASIIKNHHIRFNPHLKKLEDYEFYLSCYSHCKTMFCFPYAGYHYICGALNSSGQLVKQVDYISIIDIHHKCYNILNDKNVINESSKKILLGAMGNLAVSAFLEMSPICLSKIKNLLKDIEIRESLSTAIQSIETPYKFLKSNILKQNIHSIYLYLCIWRSYLLIRRKIA